MMHRYITWLVAAALLSACAHQATSKGPYGGSAIPPVQQGTSSSTVIVSRQAIGSQVSAQRNRPPQPATTSKPSRSNAPRIRVEASAGGVKAATVQQVLASNAATVETKRLSDGVIAFSEPKEMTEMRAETFTLRVALNEQGLHPETIPSMGKGHTQTASALVGDSLKAQLTANDADFKITALAPEVQSIPDQGAAQWKWSVTPQRHGANLELHLFVSAIVDDNVYGTPKDYTFQVRADPIGELQRFWLANYQWLIGLAITLGLGSAISRWWKRLKRPRAAAHHH